VSELTVLSSATSTDAHMGWTSSAWAKAPSESASKSSWSGELELEDYMEADAKLEPTVQLT
jgi:hypothetical protein